MQAQLASRLHCEGIFVCLGSLLGSSLAALTVSAFLSSCSWHSEHANWHIKALVHKVELVRLRFEALKIYRGVETVWGYANREVLPASLLAVVDSKPYGLRRLRKKGNFTALITSRRQYLIVNFL